MILSFVGLIILVGGNSIRRRSAGKSAPILWDALTVVVTITAAVLFYKDIIDKSIDLGPIPFILLVGYGLLSFFFFTLLPGGSDANEWKLKETWGDYGGPDYDAVHTYCSVAFDDSGKIFYYRTRNPDLRVGDFVYVPGYAPYPLERTKHIIGKAGE